VSEPLVVIDADVLGRQRTGDESYVSALLLQLANTETGLRFAAVTRNPRLVPPKIEALELPARSQPWRMAVTLPRLLRRVRPAVAHFQHVAAPRCPAPTVVTVHDLSFESDPALMGLRDRFFFRTMVPRSARRADRIVAVSELTRRDLIEHYSVDERKIVVIPNGVDPEFSPEGPKRDGPPYLLFVGSLQARKDPVTAVEAFARGSGELRLVLVGPDKGGGGEARATAERLGVADRVEFMGHVEKAELASLYRGAQALVFPSRYEGFGLPVVEAMASGTPVVASSAGAIPEVAGDAAILVQPGDPAALAAGVAEALADRDRLVRAGLEHAGRYTWGDSAARTVSLYRELL
jgi:glycosyltransferase involved in cell wall biosynthesis